MDKMAKFKLAPSVTFEIYLSLTEPEARALEALAGYDVESFLKVFYEHLGKSYMQPHEDGLRSLLESARNAIPFQLGQVDKARRAFNE